MGNSGKEPIKWEKSESSVKKVISKKTCKKGKIEMKV
jgi:hypothetical protein